MFQRDTLQHWIYRTAQQYKLRGSFSSCSTNGFLLQTLTKPVWHNSYRNVRTNWAQMLKQFILLLRFLEQQLTPKAPLLFCPSLICDFNPAVTRASVSGFPAPQNPSCVSTASLPHTVPLFRLTACLVSSLKQNFCCRKCYSTRKPNQSILAGASTALQQHQQTLLKGKVSLVFSLLRKKVLEGPCSPRIQVVKDRWKITRQKVILIYKK